MISSLPRIMQKTRVGRFINNEIINLAMAQTDSVIHQGQQFDFAIPNPLNRYRVNTFSTKEPETLEWIDRMEENCVFWDIGANVGLYSIYAAKRKGGLVFAFEPSVFNLELLARNINLNKLSANICIVPLAVNDRLGRNMLNMTSTEWGGALSTFGQDFGWDGETMAKVFVFQTIGISMVDAVQLLKIPEPDYIKMDVDGIEHLILTGALPILQRIKGILVEINDNFHEQSSQTERILRDSGLRLREKRQSEMVANMTGGFQCTFNQIWERPAV
jgi:FkbM family methyltransferase